MSRSLAFAVLSSLLVSGCNIETHEGNEGLGEGEGDDAGTGSCAEKQAGSNDAAAAASNDAGAGADADAAVTAKSCSEEADCPAGFNCDAATKTCLSAAAETCGELATEALCVSRTDCAPSYAGVDCSCGPDCKCVGGEPGCVCAGFEFFRCEPVLQ